MNRWTMFRTTATWVEQSSVRLDWQVPPVVEPGECILAYSDRKMLQYWPR